MVGRTLHNEGIHNLHSSPNGIREIKSKRMRRAVYDNSQREKKSLKSEGNRPHGAHRHRWKDIRIYLEGIWCKDMGLSHLAQDRDQWRVLVKMVNSGYH
jgi:hypothetical protein